MSIQRISTTEISKRVLDLNFRGSHEEQKQLTDIVVDRLDEFDHRALSPDVINTTIQTEIMLWENQRNHQNQVIGTRIR